MPCKACSILPKTVRSIVIEKVGNLSGDDILKSFPLKATDKDDFLPGGSGDDTIDGLADNDEIDGNQGNDSLLGNAGNEIAVLIVVIYL